MIGKINRVRFEQENDLIPNKSNKDCVNCDGKEAVSVLKRAIQNISFKLKYESCKKLVTATTQMKQ